MNVICIEVVLIHSTERTKASIEAELAELKAKYIANLKEKDEMKAKYAASRAKCAEMEKLAYEMEQQAQRRSLDATQGHMAAHTLEYAVFLTMYFYADLIISGVRRL